MQTRVTHVKDSGEHLSLRLLTRESPWSQVTRITQKRLEVLPVLLMQLHHYHADQKTSCADPEAGHPSAPLAAVYTFSQDTESGLWVNLGGLGGVAKVCYKSNDFATPPNPPNLIPNQPIEFSATDGACPDQFLSYDSHCYPPP